MQQMKILLVDDEADYLQTLAKRLSRRRLEASLAYSGEEALAFVKDNPVDVIVLDVKMPGMDGIETLRRIRATAPHVEVIMLTGHAAMESALQGMELGAFDYLIKPADFDELVYKLEDAYKKKMLHEKGRNDHSK